jgi:ATP-dependent DNA ligase
MANDYPFPKAVDYEKLTAKALKDFDPTGWLIQPKWDGCAMVVYVNNDQAWAVTASGKPVKSCDHIIKVLQDNCGDGVYAMEVWKPATLFQDISGKFRTHSAQPDLVARVFDGWMVDQQGLPYDTRMYFIHQDLPFASCVQDCSLMGEPFTTWDKAWELARFWQAQGGYDGCILRNPDAPWVEGRSKRDLIKLKPLQDYDLCVTGFKADVGEKTGRPTVALGCAWKEGQTQWVATGLTHAEQARPEAFIGRIILVRGMGLTADGFIREPRYAGVREDKLAADY